LAETYIALWHGDPDRAEQCLPEFLAGYAEASFDSEPSKHVFRARIHLHRREAEAAEREARKALNLPQTKGSGEHFAQASRVLGDALALQGRVDKAREIYQAACPTDPGLGVDVEQGLMMERLAALNAGAAGQALLDRRKV
jgi:tetratricopeptide (TPR) repeat protein